MEKFELLCFYGISMELMNLMFGFGEYFFTTKILLLNFEPGGALHCALLVVGCNGQ